MQQRGPIATEIVKSLKGGSHPFMVQASHGRHYVVKSLNNPQHRRVLANEFIAGHLALAIGLPVVQPCAICVAPALPNAGLQLGMPTPVNPARQAIYDFLPRSMFEDVANMDVAFGCWLFDCWTSNADATQIIIYRKRKRPGLSGRYWITKIDHGFCFDAQAWTLTDRRRPFAYWQVQAASSADLPAAFEPYLSRIESLRVEDVRPIVERVPCEWLLRGERQALCTLILRLVERAHRIETLWPSWWPTHSLFRLLTSWTLWRCCDTWTWCS